VARNLRFSILERVTCYASRTYIGPGPPEMIAVCTWGTSALRIYAGTRFSAFLCLPVIAGRRWFTGPQPSDRVLLGYLLNCSVAAAS